MILIIDNYDSFSHNLVQMVGSMKENKDIRVIRNDEVTVEEIRQWNPECIILSPGPGRPSDAGICEPLLQQLRDIPILGVCLGHQAIYEAFGGQVVYAPKLMHGKQSRITLDLTSPIFYGLERVETVARYHSLVGDKMTVPEELRVIALDEVGEVMGVQHKKYPIYGVQFHPESILTPNGRAIVSNFLRVTENRKEELV